MTDNLPTSTSFGALTEDYSMDSARDAGVRDIYREAAEKMTQRRVTLGSFCAAERGEREAAEKMTQRRVTLGSFCAAERGEREG